MNEETGWIITVEQQTAGSAHLYTKHVRALLAEAKSTAYEDLDTKF
ncbi:MAG: hypothetical protein HFH12_06140 [Dorea sp.]|nr:hypothetical protein [Dorea sp.]